MSAAFRELLGDKAEWVQYSELLLMGSGRAITYVPKVANEYDNSFKNKCSVYFRLKFEGDVAILKLDPELQLQITLVCISLILNVGHCGPPCYSMTFANRLVIGGQLCLVGGYQLVAPLAGRVRRRPFSISLPSAALLEIYNGLTKRYL